MKYLRCFCVLSILLFICICQSLQSFSKLMACAGVNANVIARGRWQCGVHLLTEEPGSTMPNGSFLNSPALGSISRWTVFVRLFKLIISFFRRPFTNAFTNHRTIHVIFPECSSYGGALPVQVCFCGLQRLCSGCPFPVSSPCDINN